MARPRRMVRALVVGPLDLLEPAVETLYDLELIHLVDFAPREEPFGIGRPLPKAAQVSENLLKLRAIAAALKLKGEKVEGVEKVELGADARQKIATLEVNIREEEGARKNIQGVLADVDRQIEALGPFGALGLDLSVYRGYDGVAVFVGKGTPNLEGLADAVGDCETFQSEEAAALFVARDAEERARDFLTRRGLTLLEVPAGTGDPWTKLAALQEERARWAAKLEAVEDRITKLRERHAQFIVAAEEHFTTEIAKAEAPLRFAMSEHSFALDGWVPEDQFEEFSTRLAVLGPVYVAQVEADHQEEPPVLLRNPKPVRPFESLVHLFSTPSYHEIDPTPVLFLVFPVFFGLMIGDAGYGATMIGFGVYLGRPGNFFQRVFGLGGMNLSRILVAAGAAALLFGLFMFGEAFGIPFHANPRLPLEEAEHELTWACGDTVAGVVLANPCLGIGVPLQGILSKLFRDDVITLLLLSITAALVHLGIGYAFGMINEWHHSKRHALAKAAWFMALWGFFIFLMAYAAQRGAPYARLMFDTILLWSPPQGLWVDLVGMTVPYTAIALLAGGSVIILVTEGIGFMEIFGLLGNIVSYARLAGIGVAKAATATAFNSVLFGLILGGEIVWVIVGFVFLFFAQALIFFLGALSAGIQAIRLNYVEFFLKFYKGNGVPFQPFGRRAKAEV